MCTSQLPHECAYRSSSSIKRTAQRFLFSLYVVVMKIPRKPSSLTVCLREDHQLCCCGQKGRPSWKENLPRMDWMKLNEILLKLNKYGPLCGRPKRPQNMNIYSLPCLHLSLIPYLSLLSRGPNMGFIFLIFAALSLPFSLSYFRGTLPSLHLSISLS